MYSFVLPENIRKHVRFWASKATKTLVVINHHDQDFGWQNLSGVELPYIEA